VTHDTSIALLIDADNSPASKIEEILDELAKYGVINIRRAFGNWKSPHLKGWEAVLHDHAIQPMQQFAYTKGKGATDAAMIIDAMDLALHQGSGRLLHRLKRLRFHAAGDAHPRQRPEGVRFRREENAGTVRQRLLQISVSGKPGRTRAGSTACYEKG
jgi:hypothetical protein